eukprot:CAMPEP_0172816372 /NCGR_PEP_ID=MMETSP1075-20121228/12421_1 /TAXON_ID=2916 /ORGANISM="Ceratium fusus, Strain PA161109" /LENGTH=66 /DNA_ID=CAMNT_0013656353 /DNA_START=37 /DNA_END=237 /DNA_ORIENTATION=+
MKKRKQWYTPGINVNAPNITSGIDSMNEDVKKQCMPIVRNVVPIRNSPPAKATSFSGILGSRRGGG